MVGQYLRQIFTDTSMTIFGLMVFFSSFCGLMYWVFGRKNARQDYEKISTIPMETE